MQHVITIRLTSCCTNTPYVNWGSHGPFFSLSALITALIFQGCFIAGFIRAEFVAFQKLLYYLRCSIIWETNPLGPKIVALLALNVRFGNPFNYVTSLSLHVVPSQYVLNEVPGQSGTECKP
jgi:hypothetical protein